MTAKAPIDFHKAFRDVDAAGDPQLFDTFLEAIYAGGMWAVSRPVRTKLADIKPGEHVLDAGCGVGMGLAGHAAAVGPTGKVTGVDFSRDLLARAKLRSKDLVPQPQLHHGDLQALPFPDESFDVVWSERVWMYLDRPLVAAREALRVLKPGGRLVVGEIDMMAAWSVSADESIRKMAGEATQASIGNPEIARQLPGLCMQAGFARVHVEPTYYSGRDFSFIGRASNVVWQLDRLVDAGRLTRQAADDWLATQRRLSAEGQFVATSVIPNVAAVKGP